MGAQGTASILLVDDSEDDIILIKRAFEKWKSPVALFVANSGQEALRYLQGEQHYSNRARYPLPELVLLDLKMPGMDGFEVLNWIRAEPGLMHLRVLALSSL